MWEPVQIPFINTEPLPPLPTTSEIHACTNILGETTLGQTAATKIVAVNDEIVVKYGTCVETWEGPALLLLERHAPEIPAPRLYKMYQEDQEVFLIMSRIPGVQLDSIWSSLAPSEKDDIINKLREICEKMRKVECPVPNFYGSLDGGGLHTFLFRNINNYRKYLGPFYSESDFVAGLVGNYRALIDRDKHQSPNYKAQFYEKYMFRVLEGHRSVLTHGDLQQKNIMVVENKIVNSEGGRSFDVVLVDWESAGWFPDYWEFFIASWALSFHWEDEWSWRAQEFLPVFPAELAVLQQIDRDMGV
ncbi:phosphotransferase enzyme family protein [Penicillium malachiteum]|nr:phosphotransferase enzyme family protein [Penicillium malachiteum]